MCSVRSRENNDCFVHANSFVCILNCLSVKLFFSVISWQCNIAVKITETTEVVWYNRTFAACHSRGTKLPCWDAKVALGQEKQRKLLFKIMYAFCWSCPSVVNGKLQRTYSWFLIRRCLDVIIDAFSYDVTAAILVFQNNETAAMLVYQDNPVGIELFSYTNAFFVSNEFAQMLAMWVKTLYRVPV